MIDSETLKMSPANGERTAAVMLAAITAHVIRPNRVRSNELQKRGQIKITWTPEARTTIKLAVPDSVIPKAPGKSDMARQVAPKIR